MTYPLVHELAAAEAPADARHGQWLTAIIKHCTDEGRLYLCAIKDVWSNRLVSYSIDSRM